MAGHGYGLYAGDEAESVALLSRATYGYLQHWTADEPLPALTFMHYVWDEASRCIEGHLANANPMLATLAEQPRATFLVPGAAAYVPSYWVDPERGVPTSYYGWALAEVRVEQVSAPEAVMAILQRMLARLQPEGRHPPMQPGERYWDKLLGAITGVRLHVGSVRSRHKYGQNRPATLREEIAGHLEARGLPGDAAAAAGVRDHLHVGVAEAPAPPPAGEARADSGNER